MREETLRSVSTILFLFIFGCVPVFVFLYTLVAAIGHNIRRAMSDEPYQVVGIGHIMAASGALTLILCVVSLVFASV